MTTKTKETMSNEVLNRELHKAMGLGCWHDKRGYIEGFLFTAGCSKCRTPTKNPDYTTDHNFAQKAVEFAVEKVGKVKFGEAIYEYVKRHKLASYWHSRWDFEWLTAYLKLTARMKAEIVLSVLKGEK